MNVFFCRDYVQTLRHAFGQAGVPTEFIPRIHIGGDQLTRERFSGAKRLIIGEANLPEGFDILSPITSEFFHMAMNFLQVPFTQLWDDQSTGEVGTLKAAASRLHLESIDSTVKDAYNADKDFFLSFVDAHVIELVLSHFKMANTFSVPPNVNPEGEPGYVWAEQEFKKMIRQNLRSVSHNPQELPVPDVPEGKPLQIHANHVYHCALWVSFLFSLFFTIHSSLVILLTCDRCVLDLCC